VAYLASQGVRVSQLPIMVLADIQQSNRVTQLPVIVPYLEKPIPLPQPVIPDIPLGESWTWLTAVNVAETSREQRAEIRNGPRYRLDMSVVIENEEQRRHIYNMLMRFVKIAFTYPMFQYNAYVTSAANIGDTKIYFDPAQTDVREGEQIAVFDPYLEYVHYVTIDTLDSDGANLTEELTFAVGANWQVCPAVAFRVTPIVGINMNALGGSFNLILETVNPREFITTARDDLVYKDGYLIVGDRHAANDAIQENFDMIIEWADNGTSIPTPRTSWSNAHTIGNREFVFNRRDRIDYWRHIADYFRGRKKAGLFPTFRDDIPVISPVDLNSDHFDTDNIDFGTFWQEIIYRYIRIETANGIIYRRISNVIVHYDENGDAEYLTIYLTEKFGNSSGDNVIKRVSFMNLCRLDTDEITLTHYEIDSKINFTIRAVNG